jgi:hypothetical protein
MADGGANGGDNRSVVAARVFPRLEQTFPKLTEAEIARMRRSPRATASATSRRSSTRARDSSSPKSASFPAASRWSTAAPRVMSRRC